MPSTVQCPYCNTIFQATKGTCTTCRNPECKARISIDSKGNIRESKPGKK